MERVWLPRIQKLNPDLKIIATDSTISKRSINHCTHEHKHKHEESNSDATGHISPHDRNGNDPHIWLAPPLVKQQMRTMAQALIAIDSANNRWYRKRLVDAEASIDSLHQQIKQTLAACSANPAFLTFHPSWGYFADAFALEQITVEVEGKEPGIRELGTIVAHAKAKGCTTVLIQPQFSQRITTVVAEQLQGKIVAVDPLAEKWDSMLLHLAGVLCE
jgi:zinc transport system substrate-binding protein